MSRLQEFLTIYSWLGSIDFDTWIQGMKRAKPVEFWTEKLNGMACPHLATGSMSSVFQYVETVH